ncbi:MAG: antibiotic biosynthesis monooxygenase [Halarcobacter sp.]
MSKKVYCIASFEAKDGKEQELLETLQALEPQSSREDGCIQYLVTKHISHENAMGKSFPIVFNEIWASKEAFELHCNKAYITDFFEKHCVDKNGLVKDFNVCVYSDEIN